MRGTSRLQKIRDAFRKALYFTDHDAVAIDFAFVVFMANLVKGVPVPVWAWIIGPPSSGKGEIVRPYGKHPLSVYLSTLTERALMSGYSDDQVDDPSLLPQLDGKNLVIKDFTAILGLSERHLVKVMGDLRDAYDGEAGISSGKSGVRCYTSRFGFIAATTPVIDVYQEDFQQLGERVLSIRIGEQPRCLDERLCYMNYVYDKMDGKEEWQADLRRFTHEQVDSFLTSNPNVESVGASKEDLHRIMLLSDFVVHARAALHKRTFLPPEQPGRLLQQLLSIGKTRALAEGRSTWGPSDTSFVSRVARDTTPHVAKQLLYLFYINDHMSVRSLSSQTGYTSADLGPRLSHYKRLGLIEYTGSVVGLTKACRAQINECGFFGDLTQTD